jgi:hypothetical protein
VITDWQVQRNGRLLILGIAVGVGHLDVVTDDVLLKNCLAMLRSPHRGFVHTRMGSFGPFDVTLNLHHDDSVSIFVDGPKFDDDRTQSAAIWVEKDRLSEILEETIAGALSDE